MDALTHLEEIKKLLQKKQIKLLLLDFDGTLTPLVDRPEQAVLSVEMKTQLEKLAQKKDVFLAIISGRSLNDITAKIDIPGIMYSGNHGLEYEINGEKTKQNLSDETKKTLEKIKTHLYELTKKYPGTFVEDKTFALSFHYRLAQKNLLEEIKQEFFHRINPYIAEKKWMVLSGKMVFDIKPFGSWNKGDVAKHMIATITKKTKSTPLAIFLGDDITDEDVFKVLPDDITIYVGEKEKTVATYRLKNVEEVFQFLSFLTKEL